jgi:hypothetical protein
MPWNVAGDQVLDGDPWNPDSGPDAKHRKWERSGLDRPVESRAGLSQEMRRFFDAEQWPGFHVLPLGGHGASLIRGQDRVHWTSPMVLTDVTPNVTCRYSAGN